MCRVIGVSRCWVRRPLQALIKNVRYSIDLPRWHPQKRKHSYISDAGAEVRRIMHLCHHADRAALIWPAVDRLSRKIVGCLTKHRNPGGVCEVWGLWELGEACSQRISKRSVTLTVCAPPTTRFNATLRLRPSHPVRSAQQLVVQSPTLPTETRSGRLRAGKANIPCTAKPPPALHLRRNIILSGVAAVSKTAAQRVVDRGRAYTNTNA